MRSALALVLLVLLPADLHAQIAEDLYLFGRRAPAAGARMTALGGAATAGLGDWSAAYANPAGLAYLHGAQAVISGHAFAQEPAPGERLYATDTEGVTLGTGGYAASLPVARGSLVLGGGYRETAVYAQGPVGGPVDEPVGESVSGWQGEAVLEGAMALTPRLMGGLAISAPLGHYTVDDPEGFELREANIAGVRARAGLSAALSHGIRVGVVAETPTYLRIEETELGFSDDDRPFENTIEMMTPWRIGAGVLVGGPGIFVSGDVEVVDWSQARFEANGDPDLIEENLFAARAYRTVVNSRVGAEAKLGPLALRVGAAFQPDPRFDGPTPDRVRETYAAGLGLRVTKRARLDVAFIHTRDAELPFFRRFDLVDVEAVRNAVQIGLDVRL